MEFVILIVGWSVYFFVHSLLANNDVKELAKTSFSGLYRYYRLIYVVGSTIGLLLLLLLNSSIDAPNFFNNEGVARYLSLMFTAFGVIVIKVSFRVYNFSAFVGLGETGGQPFKMTGILNSVRHPIYSGTILIAIGFWLFMPNLPTMISVLCILTYLPIGISLEERKLINEFGENYKSYKRKVPALFPKLF